MPAHKHADLMDPLDKIIEAEIKESQWVEDVMELVNRAEEAYLNLNATLHQARLYCAGRSSNAALDGRTRPSICATGCRALADIAGTTNNHPARCCPVHRTAGTACRSLRP